MAQTLHWIEHFLDNKILESSQYFYKENIIMITVYLNLFKALYFPKKI